MEERRSEDRNIAVLCQRFNDFISNSERHYQEEKEARKEVSEDLKSTTGKLYNAIKEMNEKLLVLPCSSRKILWDSKMEDIAKDSRNQWIMIGSLWSVIGACAYSIFEAWIKIWNGGK